MNLGRGVLGGTRSWDAAAAAVNIISVRPIDLARSTQAIKYTHALRTRDDDDDGQTERDDRRRRRRRLTDDKYVLCPEATNDVAADNGWNSIWISPNGRSGTSRCAQLRANTNGRSMSKFVLNARHPSDKRRMLRVMENVNLAHFLWNTHCNVYFKFLHWYKDVFGIRFYTDCVQTLRRFSKLTVSLRERFRNYSFVK